jgi:2-oxoglutarate dehydrogenase E2 component (dihydrolipoamide succinyltransferase)
MSTEIKAPVLPESIADATIVKWHKKVGEAVKRDENLVDLETDKVVLEVPAPADGILEKIVANEGARVKTGELLATLSTGAAQIKIEKPAEKVAEKPIVKPAEKSSPFAVLADKVAPAAAPAPTPAPAPASLPGVGDLSPSQRRKAAEQGIDITKAKEAVKVELAPTKSSGAREEQRVPMTRLRQRIAERLMSAKQNTAMLTTFNEVNLREVNKLRERYKDAFEKKHGVRLGYMSFFTHAVVQALKRFPDVNASLDGTDIVYHNYFDIGVAVSTERGLVVPVIRDADQLSFAQIEKAVKAYADKARNNQITLEDMTGGTFTITNGGAFGSLLSTPILNPPQSAILGMHNIVERPIAEDGQVVIRPMMYLAVSYDHRIIDGRQSVLFLKAIKEFLEAPGQALLDL